MSTSRESNSACSSSKVMTESMYGRTSGFWNSIFFAVHGPMNTTLHGADVLLMYFAIVAAGERFAEMCGAMSGNCFLM